MPIIKVDMFSGRPEEVKRDLARKLTDTYIDVVGGPASGVTILFNEMEKTNWAVSGELVSDRAAAKAKE
ncbi:tautomerase family protein [Roseovarius pelagicus]|uniref:4-oxalocrotonate tautomerase family protein n=1 Tax=Roseovarius pelagicus TaxID=2980108 RepID=A0ABY6D6M3_9RHOB|nr:4-oxalocrotonate tautomerase family protein [Roseovarius pelagicus]UXX81514.1 4-oxalocrotonate tautomerase family protein [Roseovarius pelagicus]